MSEGSAAKPVIVSLVPPPNPTRPATAQSPHWNLTSLAGAEPESPAPSRAIPGVAEEWLKLRTLAFEHLERMAMLEPRVLSGEDPGAVHDFRVASRRLQQTLDLLAPSPSPHDVERFVRRIRRCRRVLSDLRNCDVLIQHVHGLLSRKRTARRETWAAIADYLMTRRQRIVHKALRKLSRVNLASLYVRIRENLAFSDPAHVAGPAPTPVDAWTHERFQAATGKAIEQNWDEFEKRLAHARARPDAPAIHRVRIAAKRFRYLVEIFHSLGLAESGNALVWLRAFQNHLGKWHDVEVLEQTMIDMITEQHLLRDDLPLAMEIERLMLKSRKSKTAFEAKFFNMIADAKTFEPVQKWMRLVAASPSAAYSNP